MLRFISGLLSMVCTPPSHTHVAAPLPDGSDEKKYANGSHFRAPHSHVAAAFSRCMCRECCLARASAAAPSAAAVAAERCRVKLCSLAKASMGNIVKPVGPPILGRDGDPVDSVDWSALTSESTAPEAEPSDEWATEVVDGLVRVYRRGRPHSEILPGEDSYHIGGEAQFAKELALELRCAARKWTAAYIAPPPSTVRFLCDRRADR